MLTRHHIKPYQWQAYHHLINHNRSGLFMDMGLGKTVTTLMAVDHWLHNSLEASKALVISTKRIAESVWAQEVTEWEQLSHLRTSVVKGTPKQRAKALQVDADIYTIGVSNAPWLLTQYPNGSTPFDILIIDESSLYKNPSSKRFKALKQMLPHFNKVVLLTGTPTPNGLVDIWSQIYCLDFGERLGRFVTHFRNQYCVQIPLGDRASKYTLRKGAEHQIQDKIGDIAVSMKYEDYAGDRQQAQSIPTYVKFSATTQQDYEQFERDRIMEFSQQEERQEEEGASPQVIAMSAAALSNKLMQFSNGAVYDEERNVIDLHDHKLEALQDIVYTACNEGSSVLVAYNYQHDIPRIQAALKGHKVRLLNSDKDIVDWNEGKLDVLVAHPASAGHGLNLQHGGHIMVWFGMTWNLEHYQQMNKRLDRPGQKKAVRIYHLISKGTIDEDVMTALQDKASGQDAFMKAIKLRQERYLSPVSTK